MKLYLTRRRMLYRGMDSIYHILSESEWNKARETGYISADSLSSEGFIHCSFADQTQGVLDRFFPRREGLLVLELDPALLSADLRVEDTHGHGEEFPHVYGRIDTAAVTGVRTVVAGQAGGG